MKSIRSQRVFQHSHTFRSHAMQREEVTLSPRYEIVQDVNSRCCERAERRTSDWGKRA